EMDPTKYSSLAKYTQSGNVTGCPSGQACMVQKNAGLCAAFAKLLTAGGSYTCASSEAGCMAGTALKSKTGDLGETCPGGQVCCVATAAAPAAKKVTPTSYTLNNPLGTSSIPIIIGRIIAMFLGIVGAIALLVFVYGGVAWMTARGDAGQVKHAQQAIQGAVLGLIIISGSYLFADSFIKALTEMQVTNIASTGGGAGGTESTQATTEQTTLEQQQAAAAAATKAKAGSKGVVCVGDQNAAKACQADCKQFCLNQALQANVGPADHPCTNIGQNGCPTDQVCCSWKK
ncbi:MAG: pilin, partial [Patescibacteria group bacterium]